jgi:hypothetical protein
MAGIDATNILGVIGGAVIAGYLNKIIPATVNDKLIAGGKVALGIALPMFVKGKMSHYVVEHLILYLSAFALVCCLMC